MKTKNETTDRLDLMTSVEWDALTPAQRLETCVRAQLAANNAELLLRAALDRITQARAALNQN